MCSKTSSRYWDCLWRQERSKQICTLLEKKILLRFDGYVNTMHTGTQWLQCVQQLILSWAHSDKRHPAHVTVYCQFTLERLLHERALCPWVPPSLCTLSCKWHPMTRQSPTEYVSVDCNMKYLDGFLSILKDNVSCSRDSLLPKLPQESPKSFLEET